uniref:Uncharacterized protein n=1 Tax=Rhizophora mucronata TaxID=61149 RepID=A0A2P2LN25_RHIMU
MMISQEDPFTDNSERAHGTWGIPLDAEPMIPCQGLVTLSTCSPKSEENDFFDELEELPTSSSFISSTRDHFFDERIPAVPS